MGKGVKRNDGWMKNQAQRNIFCGIIGLVMMIGIVVMSTMIVKGEDDAADRELDGYYNQLEDTFEAELRCYLNDKGFDNAGITVTHAVYKDGSRVVFVSIHHKYFDNMPEEYMTGIVSDIEELEYSDELCSFELEFV